MKPEDHLQEVHKVLHMINDSRQLARLQDQLLALTINCAHWRRTLEPARSGAGLTAGHLAVTPLERAKAKRKLLEDASYDVLELSLSVKLQPEGFVVTGAVCLSHPGADASQLIGRLVKIPKPNG